ncbi:MAG: Phenylacetic acid catabolic protein [Salinigranum sp.]
MTAGSRSVPETEDEMKELIASGESIESPEQTTERYRELLTNYILIQVDNELVTHYAYSKAWHTAPDQRARLGVFSVLKDEMAHCHVSFRVLEGLGLSTEELMYERDPSEFRNNFGIEFPAKNFAHMAVSIGLVDRAGGIVIEDMNQNCSYAPYRRTLKRAVVDQRFHQKWGFTWMKRFVNHSPKAREAVQEAVDFYFPASLEWFGTPDDYSMPTEHFEYGIKARTSDEYREQWLGEVVPFMEDIGIDVPAHTTESGDVELDFDWPVAFDEEERTFRYDQPVGWDEVFDRWKRGGPIRDELREELRHGGPQALAQAAD